ncbi:SPRY domain-containing SOCS box protein 3-like isoform X2 [Simochromis diagramma]|uniref:SPRY domain-containing SOCS box protein 3-like isoform X2 n=1 Tax=Simochromis diagramma TaxID=43689 RepID=UPI001A7E8A58|nr:SPRY domain-containing SOCS box protein 3-like isoform X2 [Simochromis diagramma]
MSHCNTVSRKTTARTAMLRRGRNGRARHLAWGQTWQETDAMAVIQSSDREEQEGRTVAQLYCWSSLPPWTRATSVDLQDPVCNVCVNQISDLEPEVDYRAGFQTVSEVVALPSTVPVKRESFFHCDPEEELSPLLGVISDCLYGEEDKGFDWVWDDHCKSSGAFLSCDNRKVSFHSDYSCGTAAIRGNKELADGQHYWEIKMTSPVYGTDMMVGVGTSEVNLEKFKYNFGSLLGHDEDSWGLSYTGLFQHKGDKIKFSSRFGQGSIIGVHLDTWHGTLTFYKNRHCIGVAATRLHNKKLYPMVCSTAAKSSMKVMQACYTPTSLQYLCCARLRQMLPCCPDLFNALDLPPGLRVLLHIQLGLGLQPQQQPRTLRGAGGFRQDEPAFEPLPQPEPGVQCLCLPQPLHQSDSQHGPLPVTSNSFQRLLLSPNSSQQRLRELLLRAGRLSVQKVPLDLTTWSSGGDV